MSEKLIELKITIDENKKVKIKDLSIEPISQDDGFYYYFIAYLLFNLESALTNLISQMIESELNILTQIKNRISTKEREKMIRDLTSKFQKLVRKRLSDNKNYFVPLELKGVKLNHWELYDERKKFCIEFGKICDELIRENEKLNKTNIARKMFPRNDNEHLTFNRKLNILCLKFPNILNTYLDSKKEKPDFV